MRDLWDKPWFSVLTKLTYSAYLKIYWLNLGLPFFPSVPTKTGRF